MASPRKGDGSLAVEMDAPTRHQYAAGKNDSLFFFKIEDDFVDCERHRVNINEDRSV